MNDVVIVGAGLAGSEAAYFLSKLGFKVKLYEMRPHVKTNAHNTEKFAELVCSNSFRNSNKETSAIGLLHEELRRLNSLIIESADANQIPAGSCLAVDREGFSDYITKKIKAEDNIEIINKEFTEEDYDESKITIITSGPLTSAKLIDFIQKVNDHKSLNFFDSIAPIVYKESIDFNVAWCQSRYEDASENADYINCPMDKEQYLNFVEELIKGEKINFKDWEKDTPYFEGCLPVEVMAERGEKTLTFGPLKPVGLTNPHNPDKKPYAVVQLRRDNKLDTLYNMVGFQTKLNYKEQKRIFTKIPGLENAEFARLGGLHLNTFINSPQVLNNNLSHKVYNNLFFGGQISGCEGYVESSATGLLAAIFVASKLKNIESEKVLPPSTSALGSLLLHVTCNANKDTFQPMNINFGLFANLNDEKLSKNKMSKKDKRAYITKNALNQIDDFKQTLLQHIL